MTKEERAEIKARLEHDHKLLYADADDLFNEVERLDAACREKDDEGRWVRRKLGLPEDAAVTKVYGRMHVVCADSDSIHTLIPIWDKQNADQRRRIAELEATVERLTKSLFKAGEQLDAKDAENQKLAELLDQAPHSEACAAYFEDRPCDCWKKEADALLSRESAKS